MMTKNYFFLLILLIGSVQFISQATPPHQITDTHYLRAETFLQPNISKLVYHIHVQPNWLADSSGFWHVTQTPEGKRFFLSLLENKETQPAFDHQKLASLLSDKTEKTIDHRDLPFNQIHFPERDILAFHFDGQNWHYHMRHHELAVQEDLSERSQPGISPDGTHQAFIREYNLFVRNLETGTETQLSTQGHHLFEYANTYGWSDIMEGESGKRPTNFFVRWSPDSRKIFTHITDLRLAEKMYLLDFSVDTLYRPRLLSYYRGSPGDTTIVYNIPVVFHLETGKEVRPDLPPIPHFIGGNFQWTKASDSLYVLHAHRGFKQVDVVSIDARTGQTTALISETSNTSIEYRSMVFRRIGNDKVLISSQRSGWNHLYLYDWNTGALISTVTAGEYVVKDVIHIDEDQQLIYFMAGGREPGRNPYFDHLYRVRYDGSELRLLTPENAHHQVSLSPCRQHFVHNYSRVDMPTTSLVRELETGQITFKVSEAAIHDLLATGWTPPVPFAATGRDGQTDIHGVIYQPLDFDPLKSYPVIDYTYTGPHTSAVPRSFSQAVFNIQNPLRAFGFAIFIVDGLGTAHRSKAFRDASYNNLGGNMTCHVKALRQLAKTHDWLDTTRVGVYGHSAGGYDAARAMLIYPEFYKVGVASAADHDHRMEKAWWPEMYMGYPVGDFYHEQSNITNAHKLQGRLLIAHGGIDENVNPSATFKLAAYFIRAGKDFDMLILPSTNHSFGRSDGDYFTKIRWNYFIRHLLPAEPIHNYQFQTILQH